MKQTIYTVTITILIATSALPAWTQGKGKLIKEIASGAFLSPKSVPAISGNITSAVQRASVQAHFTPVLAPSIAAAPQLGPLMEGWEHPAWNISISQPENVRTRSWIEQQRRNLKAWQLKRQHAKQVAFQAQLAALPQLQTERTFRATDLKDFLTTPLTETAIPALPIMEHPAYLYRGLGLNTHKDIRNILTNGLRVKDVGHFSNSLLMTLAASPHDAAAISSSKYTNLTRDPQIALHYARRNSDGFPDRVAVVVSVTGENRHGPIIQVQHDIPATQVTSLLALLNIDGIPTWCRVQLQEGEFVITPYENK